MKLTIIMDIDNAAFEDAPDGHEAARILRKLADDIESPGSFVTWPLRDANGNTVGHAEISHDYE